MKLKLLRNLMGKLDVIAMQESHGDAGDSAALGRIFPDWLFLESASVGTVGGGTVLAIRKPYRNNFLHMEHTTMLPGRVHAVALSDLNGQQLVFVNFHIPPTFNHAAIKGLFSAIAGYVRGKSYRSAIFILGDFNYLEADEARYHISNGKFTRESNTLPMTFNNMFPDFTELAQPDYTRAGALRDQGFEVFSRIDRVYCSLPASQLFD